MPAREEPNGITERRNDRRSFLSQMLKTAAAGLGLAAVAGPLGAVGSARRANASPRLPNACDLYCYLQACDGCASGCNTFRCVSGCDGSTTYYCLGHGCSNFCASNTGC